jgi:hypothetical protein
MRDAAAAAVLVLKFGATAQEQMKVLELLCLAARV